MFSCWQCEALGLFPLGSVDVWADQPVLLPWRAKAHPLGQTATASSMLQKARERHWWSRRVPERLQKHPVTQWRGQLHWAVSGCSGQVEYPKDLLYIHHITQPGSATHHQFWSLKSPSRPSGCQGGGTSSCADWCCWSQKEQGRNFKSWTPNSMWRRK